MTPKATPEVTLGCLYGINTHVPDDDRRYNGPTAVELPVLRLTARRVFYAAPTGGRTRSVDRQALERDGEVRRRSAGWWEIDRVVYRDRPTLRGLQLPSLSDLKAEMVKAHPDRGGTHEAFIAARARYETARAAHQGKDRP